MTGPRDIGIEHVDAEDHDEYDERHQLGERLESVAAAFLRDIDDHEILTQHTPGDRPQGLDIESLGPDGRVYVTEVKGTAAADWRPPRMTRNALDRQMSSTWVADTLERDGQTRIDEHDQIGDGADQIGRRVIQVDERRGTLSVWEHVREDGRLDVSEGPDRVYSLDDLREVVGAQGGGPEDWPGGGAPADRPGAADWPADRGPEDQSGPSADNEEVWGR